MQGATSLAPYQTQQLSSGSVTVWKFFVMMLTLRCFCKMGTSVWQPKSKKRQTSFLVCGLNFVVTVSILFFVEVLFCYFSEYSIMAQRHKERIHTCASSPPVPNRPPTPSPRPLGLLSAIVGCAQLLGELVGRAALVDASVTAHAVEGFLKGFHHGVGQFFSL